MKMKCTILIIVLLQCIAKGYFQQGVSLIGTALSAFSPCSTYAVYMQHESGQPPSLDNYWDGTINFVEPVDNPADEFVIKISLVSPAEIILKTAGGNVEKDGNDFQIKFPTKPQTSYVNLKVQGKKGELFPDIASLHINNVDVCPNPKQWKRKPLAEDVNNVATSEDYNL